MPAVNCWEYTKCERQPGGEKAGELGVCPAATDTAYTGQNEGENGSRICWALTGTLCGARVQGTAAQKMNICLACDFYKQVKLEEDAAFRREPTGSLSATA